MALKTDLMQSGQPWQIASKIGFDALTAVTAAGSNQTGATALNCNCANVTTSSINAGVIITAPIERNFIWNSGPNTLTVYPPVGSNFVGLAANVGFTVATANGIVVEGAGTTLLPMYTN